MLSMVDDEKRQASYTPPSPSASVIMSMSTKASVPFDATSASKPALSWTLDVP